MTAIILAILVSVPWSNLTEVQRINEISKLKYIGMPERLARATDHLLGTPYALSPLGEGFGRDSDPLIRWDAVDCVTFVEQALALALTPNYSQMLAILNQIRYTGEPSYATRNHLMEAQWLPANVQRGILKDVTRQYGGKMTRSFTKVITKEMWKGKSGRVLGLPFAAQRRGSFQVQLIPPEYAVRALKKAPSGLLIIVARADRPWLVTRVSHMGVLIASNKGPLLRHASRSFGRVVDEPLELYVSRNLDYGAWTIDGLAIYEPQPLH